MCGEIQHGRSSTTVVTVAYILYSSCPPTRLMLIEFAVLECQHLQKERGEGGRHAAILDTLHDQTCACEHLTEFSTSLLHEGKYSVLAGGWCPLLRAGHVRQNAQPENVLKRIVCVI